MPLGLPVLPEVYSMKSMSSLSMGSGGQLVGSLEMAWREGVAVCHPGVTTAVCVYLTSSMGMSLGCMGTWAPVLLDTNTFLTQSHPSTASSTVSFRGMVFPPRTAWSVVITTLAEAVEEEVEEESEVVKISE